MVGIVSAVPTNALICQPDKNAFAVTRPWHRIRVAVPWMLLSVRVLIVPFLLFAPGV